MVIWRWVLFWGLGMSWAQAATPLGACDLHPDATAEAFYKAGRDAFKAQRFEDAACFFERANRASKAPDPGVLVSLAAAYLKLDRIEESRGTLRQTLEAMFKHPKRQAALDQMALDLFEELNRRVPIKPPEPAPVSEAPKALGVEAKRKVPVESPTFSLGFRRGALVTSLVATGAAWGLWAWNYGLFQDAQAAFGTSRKPADAERYHQLADEADLFVGAAIGFSVLSGLLTWGWAAEEFWGDEASAHLTPVWGGLGLGGRF